jgi:hypothetical protein
MKKTMLTAAAALSVLAFPVAADAKRGGHGHGPPEHVASQQGADDSRPAEQRSEGRRAARKCKRTQSIGFVAKGSLASFTDETVTLDVERANRHARSHIEAAGSTFTLGTARVKFEGVTDTGSGALDLADVVSTDKVVASGKLTTPKRGCEGETVLKLRKLQVVRPEVEESDDSQEEQS